MACSSQVSYVGCSIHSAIYNVVQYWQCSEGPGHCEYTPHMPYSHHTQINCTWLFYGLYHGFMAQPWRLGVNNRNADHSKERVGRDYICLTLQGRDYGVHCIDTGNTSIYNHCVHNTNRTTTLKIHPWTTIQKIQEWITMQNIQELNTI